MTSGHETSDVDVRGVMQFAGVLVLTAIAIHFFVWLLFGFFAAREASGPPREFPLLSNQTQQLPPEPRLQTTPKQDLLDLRAAEDAVLHTYGWVDKNNGIVRIPIEEAMKLTVERGLPAREEAGR